MAEPDIGTLEGRVGIVTGAGQGGGYGCAMALAARGVKLALFGRTLSKLEAVVKEIEARGGSAIAVSGDVTNVQDRQRLIDAAVEKFGRLDILVNTAQSPESRGSPIDDLTDEVIDELWQSGLIATLSLMRLARPHMKKNGVGSIINFGSASQLSPINFGAYASVKAAITTMSRAAALEWAADGVRVNVVLPYVVSPSYLEHVERSGQTVASSAQHVPLGRVGDPELDIGRAVAFLAGPDSSYITGHTVPLNGGGGYLR